MVDADARPDGAWAASTTTSAAASTATRTERTWTVPHFEKMLYDNAQLVEVYRAGVSRSRRSRSIDRIVAGDAGVRRTRDDVARRRVLFVAGRRDAITRRADSTSGRRRSWPGAPGQGGAAIHPQGVRQRRTSPTSRRSITSCACPRRSARRGQGAENDRGRA